MQIKFFILLWVLIPLYSCNSTDGMNMNDNSNITGYQLLTDLSGHWVGTNDTPFGMFEWFAFDFRPISASHLHSIYEGATNQNIISSIFIADYGGKQQIMARNGGWLGNQYRATYFVLDQAVVNANSSYYRLVDAIGLEKRAYMEFRFENDTLYFDAYKDNSGTLDDPIHHMGFKGVNVNPDFAKAATDLFGYPGNTSEVNLTNAFEDLIDPGSALFLEESKDPFPKSQHGHIADLQINFMRDNNISSDELLLYISTQPIIENGQVNFDNLNNKLIRTISVFPNENSYTATYLHPDTYYITAFTDKDGNFFPSSGDISSASVQVVINPESNTEMDLSINQEL